MWCAHVHTCTGSTGTHTCTHTYWYDWIRERIDQYPEKLLIQAPGEAGWDI
jgi:hypothetical protein